MSVSNKSLGSKLMKYMFVGAALAANNSGLDIAAKAAPTKPETDKREVNL